MLTDQEKSILHQLEFETGYGALTLEQAVRMRELQFKRDRQPTPPPTGTAQEQMWAALAKLRQVEEELNTLLTWTNLTDAQRDSVTRASNLTGLAAERLGRADSVARPLPTSYNQNL